MGRGSTMEMGGEVRTTTKKKEDEENKWKMC